MNLKLSKMKKISSDANHTTMRTKEGHVLKIAHNSLSKGHRKALEALPLISSPKMAEGGEVSDDEIIERKAAVDEYNKTHEDMPKEYDQDTEVRMQKTDVTPKAKYAEGSPDVSAADAQEIPPSPTGATSASPAMAPQAGAMPVAQAPSMEMAPAPVTQPDAVPAQVQPQVTPGLTDPTIGGQTQIAATDALGKAEQGQIQAKANELKTGIAAQQQLANDFHEATQHTQNELSNLRQDMAKGHIDPNHYLDSKSTIGKIGTAIGVFLGGFGQGSNQVLDYVNKQIDNDIKGQQANVDNKSTLYSAALKQSDSQQQAMNLTRLMMNDITLNKLQEAELKSANPIIKARAQQAIGAIQSQMAPMIQQQAMFKMLHSPDGTIKDIDPAQLIPSLVPKEAQKEVFKEVSQAQNAIRNKKSFLDNFDNAVQENSILGRASRLGFTPPSIKAMNQLALPLIHDLEGRVNEYEQKTVQDNFPQPGDTAATVDAKRKTMQDFFDQKSAASTAKGYGLDLSKFKSTSPDPAINFTPQQKAFADYAKANPNAPGSQAVLKKLGLK